MSMQQNDWSSTPSGMSTLSCCLTWWPIHFPKRNGVCFGNIGVALEHASRLSPCSSKMHPQLSLRQMDAIVPAEQILQALLCQRWSSSWHEAMRWPMLHIACAMRSRAQWEHWSAARAAIAQSRCGRAVLWPSYYRMSGGNVTLSAAWTSHWIMKEQNALAATPLT